jgi:Double-stranded RNA binding motif
MPIICKFEIFVILERPISVSYDRFVTLSSCHKFLDVQNTMENHDPPPAVIVEDTEGDAVLAVESLGFHQHDAFPYAPNEASHYWPPPPPPPPLENQVPFHSLTGFPAVAPPPLQGHPAVAMVHYYEARMRDAAASFANAAAGAAWAAAMAAQSAAEYATTGSTHLPPPPTAHWTPWQQPPFPHDAAAAMDESFQDETAAFRPPTELVMNAQQPERHRRKRLPRKGPQQPPEQERKSHAQRRRVRSDVDSCNSSDVSNGGNYNPSWRKQHHRNQRHRAANSGSEGNEQRKKARSDDSLLGHTALAALYEWCSKRQRTLSVVACPPPQESSPQLFGFCILLQNVEYGRGYSRNKNGAKQEAARRALQHLVPGIVFDEATGLLVSVPDSHVAAASATTTTPVAPPASPRSINMAHRLRMNSEASLDELGPHLAQTLAIGHLADQPTKPEATCRSRTWNVYPGASTTSEDENENTYYASRGASVCSALLHAMVQIDARIQGPPAYTYDTQSLPALFQQQPPPAAACKTVAARVARGSFTCTARLMLLVNDQKHDAPSELVAIGVGGTKRESRHVASAKLLAMLFPDCETMVEVKAAAEEFRERYTAGKSKKKMAKNGEDWDSNSERDTVEKDQGLTKAGLLSRISRQSTDFPLSADLASQIRDTCFPRATETCGDASPQNLGPSVFRQASRRRQLDSLVESALQSINERDEDGRFLPGELTEDDVGRTVLRRAGPEDLPYIRNLLGSIAGGGDDFSGSLWSESQFVLFLCRAIAVYEDPPLGCAVLTLGFSFESGRSLRIVQLATETHLPKERFLERLESLAVSMNCSSLERSYPSIGTADYVELSRDDLYAVVRSHIEYNDQSALPESLKEIGSSAKVEAPNRQQGSSETMKRSPLQSVQEEEQDSGGASDSSVGADKKTGDKPSKRTRVH